jgi:hypothetical protein
MVDLPIQSSMQGFLSTLNRCRMDLSSAWLALTCRHHHQQQLPSSWTLWERVSWHLWRLSLCLFTDRFSGCLELFYNSHLSVFRERSLEFSLHLCRPTSCLAITRTIWSKWTRASWSLELVWDSWPPISRTSLPHLITSWTFWSE